MVAARLEQVIRYVRQWRSVGDDEALVVGATLPAPDLRRIRRLVDLTVDRRGGEMAARRRARSIGATFSTLDPVGRRRFFQLLADEYGHDDEAVDLAMGAVFRAEHDSGRRQAESDLREALQPRRERLMRRFAGLDGGLPFLIALREDLLAQVAEEPRLGPVDTDLKRILEGWFDVALLRLERLTWHSPAVLLERLIEYEAVHAIDSWEDLKGRLGPGRRCYAFLHPAMPDDPLVFVEVALTEGIATSLPPVLDHEADRPDPAEADTAIFYSISSCHRGLSGVSLGDLLIKSVVQQLAEELPNLARFATLSPLPGFRRWLGPGLASGDLTLTHEEVRAINSVAIGSAGTGAPDVTGSGDEATGHSGQGDDAAGRQGAIERLRALIAGPLPPVDGALLVSARPALLRLAADYLLNQRRGIQALDPVAHFHLSNGASIDQLNWAANPTSAGWERGLGIMVNYRYRLRHIEQNHDRYMASGEIASSDGVRRLMHGGSASDHR